MNHRLISGVQNEKLEWKCTIFRVKDNPELKRHNPSSQNKHQPVVLNFDLSVSICSARLGKEKKQHFGDFPLCYWWWNINVSEITTSKGCKHIGKYVCQFSIWVFEYWIIPNWTISNGTCFSAVVLVNFSTTKPKPPQILKTSSTELSEHFYYLSYDR